MRALNVRAIAEAAGISTIGIYSHFQGKQGILDALYIEGFEQVFKAMDVPVVGIQPKDAVLLACHNYLENADIFEAHYRLIFGQADAGYAPSVKAVEVSTAAFIGLTKLVARLLPPSATRTEQQDAAIKVWSVIHGFVCLKQHSVAKLVDMSGWKSRALTTLKGVVNDIEKTAKSEKGLA